MLPWLIALSLLSHLTYPGGGDRQQLVEGEWIAAAESQEIQETAPSSGPSARLILEARKVSMGVILTVTLDSSRGIAAPVAAASREISGPQIKRTGSLRRSPMETVMRGMRLFMILLLMLF